MLWKWHKWDVGPDEDRGVPVKGGPGINAPHPGLSPQTARTQICEKEMGVFWGFRIVFSEVYLTKTPRSNRCLFFFGLLWKPLHIVYLVLKLSAWYVLVKFLYSAETKHFDSLSFSRMGFLQKITLMLDPGWLNHGLLPSDWKGSNLWTDEIESSHQSMTHQSLTTSNIVSYSFTAPQLIRWGLLVCCVGHYIAVKAHAGEI